MDMKWPRRRLLAMIGTISTLGGIIFPEMSLKAQAATSTEDPWSKLYLVDAQEITGTELALLQAGIVSSPDVRSCGGPLDFSKAEFKAVRHRIANSNNHFLAVAWFFPSSRHALVYWQLDEAINHIKTRGFLYQLDTKGENAELVSLSINKYPVSRTVTSTSSIPSSSECSTWYSQCSSNPNCTCPGYHNYPAPICCSMNFGYVLGCCVTCIFAGELAAICVLVFCPICLVANACNSTCGYAYCC